VLLQAGSSHRLTTWPPLFSQVKPHALYHACKAKKDGLQDRCKACRAELDQQRLQAARSNSVCAPGAAPRARPMVRSQSTPMAVRRGHGGVVVKPAGGSKLARSSSSQSASSVRATAAVAAGEAAAAYAMTASAFAVPAAAAGFDGVASRRASAAIPAVAGW